MALLEQIRPMTIDAFLAFAEATPDGEQWELIDGEAVMNPSPSFNHQKIGLNLLFELHALERKTSAWSVLPGIGVKLSKTSMPVPDVLVRPRTRITGHVCDDMIVAIEVLSPSSRSMDLRWKRTNYPKLPTLRHYLVIHQDEVVVRCYDGAANWAERRLDRAEDILDLPAVGVSLPVSAIYADTGL